ncbi:hypothetical protein A6V39_02910 [Candidatus Mycoplasma haematobovis]|uniref:Uncharacterized protein n=1 Tax=Candidatus Mycoplasma haematobovis TaxID=432608 RepID=A0A1A9QEC9_9MOLU|nr:hypothetical protein A6V39_02910 [Candidatus Mycoplasma haematobovis]
MAMGEIKREVKLLEPLITIYQMKLKHIGTKHSQKIRRSISLSCLINGKALTLERAINSFSSLK